MQPNQVIAPPPQPPAQSPFDFMMQNQQKPKGRFSLSGGPKPLLILVVLIVILFAGLILSSVFRKSGPNNAAQITSLVAQNQEIIRVTTANQKSFTDANDLNFSATVITALTSQQTQFTTYLTKIHAAPSDAQLASRLNKATDTTLQNAVTNNEFDSVYAAYLRTALQAYQNSISATAKTSSKNFFQILNTAYGSNKVLLASTQLASTSN